MLPFSRSRFSHYFLEVARSGSLRKAAEQLHVSASAINCQILQAEEELGMRLTSVGELLCDDLRRWQREYQHTRQRFDEIQGLRRGHVSFGLIQALNDGALADALSQIAQMPPWLRLDLSMHDSAQRAGRDALSAA
nr:Chemotaxis protein CheA [Candidatus Pantoea persica]